MYLAAGAAAALMQTATAACRRSPSARCPHSCGGRRCRAEAFPTPPLCPPARGRTDRSTRTAQTCHAKTDLNSAVICPDKTRLHLSAAGIALNFQELHASTQKKALAGILARAQGSALDSCQAMPPIRGCCRKAVEGEERSKSMELSVLYYLKFTSKKTHH